jgi:hypothetical protein
MDLPVTFSDPTFDVCVYMQMEYVPGAFIDQLSYLTAVVISLAKPPTLHRDCFNVTVFESNLINRDSIKKVMADALAKAAWDAAGFPNGLVMDKVTGKWRACRVYGDSKMNRCSMSEGELLRYSRIKKGAAKKCAELKLPEPMTVQIIGYKDTGTSTENMILINEFLRQKTLETMSNVLEGFRTNPGSSDELRLFIGESYEFVRATFKERKHLFREAQKRNDRESARSVEEGVLGPVYAYMNFLELQKRLDPGVGVALALEKKVEEVLKMIKPFHDEIAKAR